VTPESLKKLKRGVRMWALVGGKLGAPVIYSTRANARSSCMKWAGETVVPVLVKLAPKRKK
jgi:uncharacterized membrane protein YdcZ (DUF606 family)